MENCVIPNS
uniref:Uncharacterized protein n=1 Tax=Arundo donax TaxID=35708 RepID=A0A0A9ARH6_ARUDO